MQEYYLANILANAVFQSAIILKVKYDPSLYKKKIKLYVTFEFTNKVLYIYFYYTSLNYLNVTYILKICVWLRNSQLCPDVLRIA